MMVEIPPSLIERLQGLGPHFIRVAREGKNPIDQGWVKNPLQVNDHPLQSWLSEGGNYGVAAGDGLAILDADNEELKQLVQSKFPPSFSVESPGHKGLHYYFLSNLSGKMFLQTKRREHGGEILWSGFMAVGPGSIHPNGQHYRVINDVPLARISKEQLTSLLGDYLVPEKQIEDDEETARIERQQTPLDLEITKIIPSAGLTRRGDECFGAHPIHGSETGHNFWINTKKNVWHCFRHQSGGGPLLWLAVQEGLIQCEEARPGVLRGELFKKVLEKVKERGLIEKQPSEGEKRSQASTLVELALEKAVTLFHDERKEPYIRLQRDGSLLTFKLRSREVKAWLSSLLWGAKGKAPSSEALASALNVLEAKANEGEEHRLYNRIAPGEEGSIWLDLADDRWRAIHITRAGWEIIEHPPILFRRYSHQQPLPEPVKDGSLDSLLDYAHITHLGDQLLYVVTAMTYLIPDIPHVVLIIFGPQGSGKTWALRAIRYMIDPSLLDVLSLPSRYQEVVQNMDHHWCAFYDNVSGLPEWLSNVFCRAVTGTGVSKRQLYTDDDDVVYSYRRCLGLTGINIAAERGDLLERGILIGLEAIPEEYRQTERSLWTSLKTYRPEVLGAMLDTLTKALDIYHEIKLPTLNRMADYAMWGCAIAKTLGIDPQHFLDSYRENIMAQNLEAVRASPVSDVLIKLMESHPLGWEGTPSQLYSELEETAKELKISTRQKAWPKKPHVLSRMLNELAPSLPAIGFEVDHDRSGKNRLTRITAVTSVMSVTRQTDWGKGDNLKSYMCSKCDASDDSYAISESFSSEQVAYPQRAGLKPTLIERVENYVHEHRDVGTLKASEDLNIGHEEFLKIAASSPKLSFDSVDRRTVRWRQYFDHSSNDFKEEDE